MEATTGITTEQLEASIAICIHTLVVVLGEDKEFYKGVIRNRYLIGSAIEKMKDGLSAPEHEQDALVHFREGMAVRLKAIENLIESSKLGATTKTAIKSA